MCVYEEKGKTNQTTTAFISFEMISHWILWWPYGRGTHISNRVDRECAKMGVKKKSPNSRARRDHDREFYELLFVSCNHASFGLFYLTHN